MRIIPAGDVSDALDVPSLMDRIREYFRSGGEDRSPVRYVIEPGLEQSAQLDLSSAWRVGGFIGVRIKTDFPDNQSKDANLPRVMSTYLLLSGKTGEPMALIDGFELAVRRRAACSALAAQLLARPDCERLLMIGASPLALALTQAILAVRPVCNMLVYAKDQAAAGRLSKRLNTRSLHVEPTDDLKAAVEGAHIVCHTGLDAEPDAGLNADWLQLGQHLDWHDRGAEDGLADLAMIRKRARLTACGEAMATQHALEGSLSALIQGYGSARNLYTDITGFINEGSALADLASAKLAFERA